MIFLGRERGVGYLQQQMIPGIAKLGLFGINILFCTTRFGLQLSMATWSRLGLPPLRPRVGAQAEELGASMDTPTRTWLHVQSKYIMKCLLTLLRAHVHLENAV